MTTPDILTGIDWSEWDTRVAEQQANLADASVGTVIGLALEVPGGAEFPNAPIDPAMHTAAMNIIREAGLEDVLAAARLA